MALTKPTPPTPPTIDKGEATESAPMIDAHKFFEVPFKREKIKDDVATEIEKLPKVETPVEKTPPTSERKVTTPEDMAREAVANGSGPLVKKTITRPETETNSSGTHAASNTPRQNVPVANDRAARGKEILREFQNEDRETFQVTETPRTVKINQNESYSGFYWVVMLVFAGILSFVFVKKFLWRKNPKLKKSDLFEDSSERLRAFSEKVSAPKVNTVEKIPAPKIKPVEKVPTQIKKPTPKNDDDKGKHFEIRV